MLSEQNEKTLVEMHQERMKAKAMAKPRSRIKIIEAVDEYGTLERRYAEFNDQIETLGGKCFATQTHTTIALSGKMLYTMFIFYNLPSGVNEIV